MKQFLEGRVMLNLIPKHNIMKTLIYKIAIFATALIFAGSCQVDPNQNDPGNGTGDGIGYLVLNESTINVNTIVTKNANLLATFIVTITNNKDNSVVYTDTYANLKALLAPIELVQGEYKVAVSSPKDIVNVGWETPSYYGFKDIIIVRKETTTVNVTCKLSNIQANVVLEPELAALFKPDTDTEKNMKVTLSLGESKDFFVRDEIRSLFFKSQADKNTLDIQLDGSYNLAGVGEAPNYIQVSWKKELNNVKAGEWRKINIKLANSNDGSVNFEVTVENWVYDEEINVDIMTASSTFTEEVYVDVDDKTTDAGAPVITLGNNHDISKPYLIDENSFDWEGICFDKLVINIAPGSDATIKTFDAVVSSDNISLIESLKSKGFKDNIVPMFPFDASVTDFMSFRDNAYYISNAGMNSLFKFEGTHIVKFIAVDTQNRRSYTEFEIVVKRPIIEGGLEVIWVGHDFATTHQLTSEADTSIPVLLDVNTSEGISGFVIEIKSSVLNDGFVDLASTMDLVNPATEAMNASLRNFGFPTREQVSGKQTLSFDITMFMPMLGGLNNGLTEFTFTVTDSKGSVTETLKINVNMPIVSR